MSSRYVPKEFSHYHDFLVCVMLQSPNDFTSSDEGPVDQPKALKEAFETLQEAFPLVEKKLKDDYLSAVLRELIQMSYGFFSAGDIRNGIYALQEVEGTVWPSRRVPPRHAPDAERRVYGELQRYAGVTPNPYPYEGSAEDMGKFQRQLFEAVLTAYESGSESLHADTEHHWLLGVDSVTRRTSERSKKAAVARLTQELSTSSSLAALRAVNVCGDLLIYDVEEAGRPRISVRGKPEVLRAGKLNFIVDEAQWIASPTRNDTPNR